MPFIDFRVRWREELEQLAGTSQKASDFDVRFRLTWQFTIKDF